MNLEKIIQEFTCEYHDAVTRPPCLDPCVLDYSLVDTSLKAMKRIVKFKKDLREAIKEECNHGH